MLSNDVENPRDRFPGCTVLICGSTEDDTLVAWGTAEMSWRSSGGSAGVDGGRVDEDAGRGKTGNGFVRMSATESARGVDVTR